MTTLPTKRKQVPINSDSESDGEGGDFDIMEFAALANGGDDTIESLKRVQHDRPTINNTQALLLKAQEVALPQDWPWIETMDVLTLKPVDVDDVEDDLKREAVFYKSATAAVKQAIIQLDQSNMPYRRPTDYYAESVKPDAHMAKVKQVLLNEKKRVQEIEDRKKQKEIKKFAKSVHSERIKEKAKKKRDMLDKVDALKRKTRSNNVG